MRIATGVGRSRHGYCRDGLVNATEAGKGRDRTDTGIATAYLSLSECNGAEGDFMCGFAFFYGTGSSLLAETRALHDGLRLALDRQLNVSLVYSDSATLVRAVIMGRLPHWSSRFDSVHRVSAFVVCLWWLGNEGAQAGVPKGARHGPIAMWSAGVVLVGLHSWLTFYVCVVVAGLSGPWLWLVCSNSLVEISPVVVCLGGVTVVVVVPWCLMVVEQRSSVQAKGEAADGLSLAIQLPGGSCSADGYPRFFVSQARVFVVLGVCPSIVCTIEVCVVFLDTLTLMFELYVQRREI
ncbi:hypothetical protein Taro_003314 [Colocasia esculenta]|uniref:RNase H type-1 domain-containing protein n=1 Tax=Colocasia esculenta TaxID=4460 RepID=A0A843TRG5_COLES|nr:hypothetical protein [Colocasia esculenta]